MQILRSPDAKLGTGGEDVPVLNFLSIMLVGALGKTLNLVDQSWDQHRTRATFPMGIDAYFSAHGS